MQNIIKIKFYVEIDDDSRSKTTLGGCIKLSKSVTRMNFYGYYCHYVKLPGISWCCVVFELDVEPKNLSGAGIRKFFCSNIEQKKKIEECLVLFFPFPFDCAADAAAVSRLMKTLANKFLRLLLCKHKINKKYCVFL